MSKKMKTTKSAKAGKSGKNPALKTSGPVKMSGSSNKLNAKMWRGSGRGK